MGGCDVWACTTAELLVAARCELPADVASSADAHARPFTKPSLRSSLVC